MPWHRPRFHLAHIIALVAVIAVELAAMRAPFSWAVAAFSLASVLLASALGPLTKIEWFGIVAIHIFLIGLLEPATRRSWCPASGPTSTTTSSPRSGKL